MIEVSADEFKLWARCIYGLCGISLDASKTYLIETRLAPLLQETGSRSFTELHFKLNADSSNVLRRKVVDAVTTNETSFFRDGAPFELLQHKILPDLIDRRRKTSSPSLPLPLRIWSAACSTGQEVYSTAIVLKELLGDLNKYDVRILGTDISDRTLAAASYAHYAKYDLDRGLSAAKFTKYFSQNASGWKVCDELRALATFRKLNLLEPFSFPVKYDIIFCRNVAIYFNEADRTKLFNNLARVLAADGALIIGSTESLTGLCPQFEAKRYLRSVFYQLKEGR